VDLNWSLGGLLGNRGHRQRTGKLFTRKREDPGNAPERTGGPGGAQQMSGAPAIARKKALCYNERKAGPWAGPWVSAPSKDRAPGGVPRKGGAPGGAPGKCGAP
jgi:hypothetical protein